MAGVWAAGPSTWAGGRGPRSDRAQRDGRGRADAARAGHGHRPGADRPWGTRVVRTAAPWPHLPGSAGCPPRRGLVGSVRHCGWWLNTLPYTAARGNLARSMPQKSAWAPRAPLVRPRSRHPGLRLPLSWRLRPSACLHPGASGPRLASILAPRALGLPPSWRLGPSACLHPGASGPRSPLAAARLRLPASSPQVASRRVYGRGFGSRHPAFALLRPGGSGPRSLRAPLVRSRSRHPAPRSPRTAARLGLPASSPRHPAPRGLGAAGAPEPCPPPRVAPTPAEGCPHASRGLRPRGARGRHLGCGARGLHLRYRQRGLLQRPPN